MDPHYAELIGVGAAAASVYAAHSKTIIPLRVAAIVANALAMTYSLMHGTYPTVVLNALLLPLNAWRLRAMLGLIHDIDAATKGDMNVDWLLPYTRPQHFKAGDVIMERGEYAAAAFYIVSGEVEIVGINETYGKGTLLGRSACSRRMAGVS
jgi:CRP/FNR family transcriptional regulator, cyclic AMP receptor protein